MAALPAREQDALARVWALAEHAAPPAPPFAAPDVAALMARLTLPSTLPLAEDHTPARRARLRMRTWARAGMALALTALGAVAVVELVEHRPAVETATVVEQAAPGQMRTLRLADGTTVTLAGGSTIEARIGDNRRVTLRGEAFFDVEHDAARPFVVDAGGVTVQVLGTAFNVRAYAGSAPSVAVQRGRVAVTRGTSRVVLNRDEEVVAVPAQALNVQPVRHGAGAWRTGGFYADDAPLSDIAADIERRFGTPVTLADGLGDRRWTVALPDAASDTTVLDALAGPMGLRYVRTAQGVRIER